MMQNDGGITRLYTFSPEHNFPEKTWVLSTSAILHMLRPKLIFLQLNSSLLGDI
jgi:hypothetical protein